MRQPVSLPLEHHMLDGGVVELDHNGARGRAGKALKLFRPARAVETMDERLQRRVEALRELSVPRLHVSCLQPAARETVRHDLLHRLIALTARRFDDDLTIVAIGQAQIGVLDQLGECGRRRAGERILGHHRAGRGGGSGSTCLRTGLGLRHGSRAYGRIGGLCWAELLLVM